MDKILYNGNFHTLDQAYKHVSAIAIKDGIIVKMGSDDEMKSLADEHTELMDLQGKLVLPGFMDTHLHLLFFGTFKRRVDLRETTTFAEAVNLCKAKVAKAKEQSSWVIGCNFNQMDWSDIDRLPDRHDLDKIAEDVPVALQRACGHVMCLNSKALELTGLSKEKQDETKLLIDFGPDGKPNGYVRESTAIALQSTFETYNKDDMKHIIVDACNAAAAQGITQLQSDDFNVLNENDYTDVIKAYQELSAEGKLPIRVVEQVRFASDEQLQEFLAAGHRFNDTYGNFKIGPLKIIEDGSLGSHTAAMRKPYKNDPDATGILLRTEEQLHTHIEPAYQAGFPVITHCIGDAALETTCNVLDRLNKEYPSIDRRNGIVHCQIMDEALQDRFKELNLQAYVQPVFIKADSQIVDDCVGTELAKQSYNWRRFKDMGIHMSGGSDCPVEPFDILPNIFHAVTRKGKKDGPAWYPENGVTLDEAVEMFTKEAAYSSYDERSLGTLSIGKYADLVVLDRDIFHNAIEEILDTQVDMTMVAGKIVFCKSSK